MKRIFPFFTAIFLIASCASNETEDSRNVKQSEIYQTYRISWEKGSGTSTASFRFGGENGTTLRLSDPSKVTFNEQQLTESKFLFGGAYYEGEQHNYSPRHIFQFTDADGKLYENSYRFDDVEFINPPKTISKNENLVLELNRTIETIENIYLGAQSDTSKSNSIHIGTDSEDAAYYDPKLQKLIVKPEFFRDFTDVPVSIWLYKNEFVKPLKQQGTPGGELHFDFKSDEISIRRINGPVGK